MSDTTAQLKRKRESVGGQQKKVKKSRKSESAERDGADNAVNGAPAAQSNATVPSSKTPNKSKPAKESTQTNGVSVDSNAGVDATADISAASDNQKKNERRNKKKDNTTQAQGLTDTKDLVKADLNGNAATGPAKAKRKNKNTKWTISPAQGGWFLPADPIFSSDEKYLLLATLKSLQVYNAGTSLLANTLSIKDMGVVITAYALSSTKPSQVYVADSNGLIILWDWVKGTKVGRWDIGATVRNMVVVTQPGTEDDLVYCHETGDKHIINVHALRTKSQASKTELKRVLKASSSVQSLQVLLQGKYVIIATADSITIGKRLKVTETALQDFEYVWREFRFSKRITTFNTFFRPRQISEKAKKSGQEQKDVLDLAVGEETGVILLFEDILASFAALESSQKNNKTKTDNADILRPKRLHWHREAVGSVKWSLDGNYLISGGDETVLTIWQLATGKPQHLPHLTAAIESVVVSPTGTSYALSLANNSVVVLSTTELEAKTNIIGLQSRRVDMEQMPRESASSQSSFKVFHSVPMSVNPKDGRLLLSVPSSQPRQKNEGLQPQPYLQAFDIANNRPVARQALTRNNATDPNMAPEGGRILEPNVKLLQVSHDGEWLATVDEWLPPRSDTGFLDEGIEEFNEAERLLRREVYLKFWRWDVKKEQWVLEARQDAPHFFEDAGGNGRVFDLVADPAGHGFATVGEDQVARIWRPKTRLRDGIVVRGAEDKGLINWSLSRSIKLPKSLGLDASTSARQATRASRLAWSADGSILVAAVSGVANSDTGLVHLIDPYSGSIRRSMTEIDATALCLVGIVGRHMVVVADCITVWDLVSDRPIYFTSINTPGIDSSERKPVVRFATNERNSTFAISLPHFEKKEGSRLKKATSKISVYSTAYPQPLWSHTIAGITLGLVATAENGYIALDSTSCVRTISRTVAGALPTPPPEEWIDTQRADIDDVEEIDGERKKILVEDAEYDRPVVTQQDLEKLFHNGNALPPPKEMFSAVIRLFGGIAEKAVKRS